MNIDFLKNRISCIANDIDIIILKGFSVEEVQTIAQTYKLLDWYIISGSRIDFSRISATQLLQKILMPSDGCSIIFYESFLDLTTMLRNLSVCNKRFCILENNLLTRYRNQTTCDIPDFDNPEFCIETDGNNAFSKFYSYCQHDNGIQYIQYMGYYIDNDTDVKYEPLIIPKDLSIAHYMHYKDSVGDIIEKPEFPILSPQNGSIDAILEEIYYNGNVVEKQYSIDFQDINAPLIKTLNGASYQLDLNISFVIGASKPKIEVRPDLYEVLKNIWGYNSFRKLKMYKDLAIDKSIGFVSQGEIIETVIQQAEKSINLDSSMKNILLTSPTGAGKSLLFQLAAIYIANKYKALTIVVSPLVALMNDQVDNLVGSYKGVATMNGNIPPTKKEEILEQVKDGEVSILYMAPELLLSYSISSFIGDRRIGLFVVDEAHTVTTWGRDFRVDYWFLGDYLRQSKRFLGYNFPIFALTATAVWDISGKNDMVFDTIRSLYMDPCIKYIGVARRDDIHFDIKYSDISKNYEKKRNELTIKRICEAIDSNCKSIFYFPFKSSIYKIMKNELMDGYIDKVTEYHASLNPNEKTINAEDFKTGRKVIMCATKAYGMGIDVSDIKMVYHHAPTGCLSDYVQEIGRVARDESITGIAKIDFSEYDFRYTRTLHGLSTIKTYQLEAVLKKLMALYRIKGEKRNMLISSSDFEYIFTGKDVDYDQKVKSCLLLISHDLLNKLGFNAIIVRPKNLFSKSYVSVSSGQTARFREKYKNYIHEVNERENVFLLDTDKLWNKNYFNLTFPNFKRKIADGEIFRGFDVEIINRIDLYCKYDSVEEGRMHLIEFFKHSKHVLDTMSSEHRRISFDEIKAMLPSSYTPVMRDIFLESFKVVYASEDYGSLRKCCTIYAEFSSIQLINQGYEKNELVYLDLFDKNIRKTKELFFCSPYIPLVKLCELLNSLEIADYQRIGGEKPSIFVRINNPVYISELIRRGHYDNKILNGIYEKFKYSERIFNYFFTTEMTDKERWDFIESYFLGASEDELMKLS